jgi:hypothetical protein
MSLFKEFVTAITTKNMVMANHLLELEPDPKAWDESLVWAAGRSNKDVVTLLLNHGANVRCGMDEPLRKASAAGNTDVVALLLDRGADINALNGAALRQAVWKRHVSTAKLLLERGADPEVNDHTPLLLACNNTISVLEVLIIKHYSTAGLKRLLGVKTLGTLPEKLIRDEINKRMNKLVERTRPERQLEI